MADRNGGRWFFPLFFFHNITSTSWKTDLVKKYGKMKLRKNTFSHNFFTYITSSLKNSCKLSKSMTNFHHSRDSAVCVCITIHTPHANRTHTNTRKEPSRCCCLFNKLKGKFLASMTSKSADAAYGTTLSNFLGLSKG